MKDRASEIDKVQSGPVVFLTSRFTTGGATLNAHMLAQHFIKRGVAAELWCLYRSADMDRGDVPVRIIFDRPPRSPLDLAAMGWAFRQQVIETKPKAMFGFHPLANTLGALVARGRCPFIGSQRNPAQSQSRALGALDRLLGSTKLYSANIAVSNSVRASYAGHGRRYLSKLQVIPNGLPPLPKVDEDQQACRAALGLPLTGYMAGNVGRLHPQKSPDFVLDLSALLPEVTFVLAGDGPDEARLRDQIDKRRLNVRLLGRVEGKDITRTLKALNLFIFPSQFEGFGRALIEALSMGLPVIAHDLPVTREVMGEVGEFLPLDANAWVERIRYGMQRVRGEADADAAIARAHSFSLDVMVDGYMSLLSQRDVP